MSINLMNRIQEFWDWLISSKYVKALELEVARLRAENRALMNSILGIAGIPPVVTPNSTSGVSTASAAATDKENSGANGKASGLASVPTAVRRRSWQQVNRALEIEAAKKKNGGPTES
jgi:hypothetical protein